MQRVYILMIHREGTAHGKNDSTSWAVLHGRRKPCESPLPHDCDKLLYVVRVMCVRNNTMRNWIPTLITRSLALTHHEPSTFCIGNEPQ